MCVCVCVWCVCVSVCMILSTKLRGEACALSLVHSPTLLCCAHAVANISFETTEEQLREVLSEVGPIVSLK